MKRLCAALPALALVLAFALAVIALPAAGLASDMFPKPPVPSSRDMGRTKMTRTAKTGQTNANSGPSSIKLGKVVKSSSDTGKTTTTKPPASLQ